MAYSYETKDTTHGKAIELNSSGDSVEALSTEYLQWMDESLLPRSLYAGTMEMRLKSTTFLLKHPLETDTAYKLRIAQSVLFNAFAKTVSFLAGQVFQADVVWNKSVDQDFQDMMKSCDFKGNSINVFAKRVFCNGLAKGVSHILVDAPEIEGNRVLSVAEERNMGIRPYFKEIRPEDIIGWVVDEDGVLLQVRLIETVPRRQGKYGYDTVKRIRVYNSDGTWEIWEIDVKKDGVAQMVKEGALSYPGIPIASFIPGEEMSPMTGTTPLMDLAWLNLTHWQSYSDQRNILSVGRVPILFGRHIKVEQMPAGISTLISSEDDNSDIKYVEIVGNAIRAGAEDITDLEEKMALWGLQQLIPKTGGMTATEKALTSRENNSALGTWATEYESCLQNAFSIFEQMRGREFPEEGVELNKEYNLGVISSEEGNLLLGLKKERILSEESAFNEFRRRGIIDENLDWEDIEAEKEKEKMNAPDPLAGLGGSLFGGSDTNKDNADQNKDDQNKDDNK